MTQAVQPLLQVGMLDYVLPLIVAVSSRLALHGPYADNVAERADQKLYAWLRRRPESRNASEGTGAAYRKARECDI